MITLDPTLYSAPVSLVLLDDDDSVLAVNKAASRLGISPQSTLSSYFEEVSEPFLEHIKQQPASHLYLFKHQAREKKLTLVTNESDKGLYVWLLDNTENIALAAKLRQLIDPNSRLLRQINHQVTTAVGYAELLDVILAGNQVLSAEKLSIIQNYQREVTTSLATIRDLSGNDTQSNRKKSQSDTILVVDSHQALLEVISELLKSEGYRVAGFTDAMSAIKYYTVNKHKVEKAVIDEAMRDGEQRSLIQALSEISPELSIIPLSAEEHPSNSNAVRKPLDYQLLLKALQD